MSDTAPTTAETTAESTSTETSGPDTGDLVAVMGELGLEPGQLAERLKASRKWEERAKANAQAAKELEEFKRQSMSETEQAIDQARSEGRQQALAEAGSKIAAAELRAAATGRMSDEQVDTLLDGLNLGRFVGEDGEVDRAAVTAFVDGIAPKPTEDATTLPVVDLGQGTRNAGQHTALNGDPLLADLKSKLGVR